VPRIGFLLVLVLAGCGGPAGPASEPGGTGGTEPKAAKTETTAPSGVSGTLDFDGIGDVRQGMSQPEVEEAFGKPAETNTVPGCELDAEASPSLVLTDDSPHGETSINIEKKGSEVLSYSTDDTSLETVQGIHVGDSYDEMTEAAGADLKPLVLGAEPTPDNGFWYLEKGPQQRLTFQVEHDRVSRILGGYTPACE
jgi:hypothetical protein